ncbi:MAG: ferritin-like domain-containing protein [Solirubrobacteraceae bacterium]
MTHLSIAQVDLDGAIREGAEQVQTNTRTGFMSTGAKAAAGIVGGGALLALLPQAASAASAGDLAILNFALTLEYLERDFYAEALRTGGAGSGEQRRFAEVAHAHEAAHVTALRKALGRSAISSPRFDFGHTTRDPGEFRLTAVELEDTGVRAYKGQAPLIKSKAVLAAALSIHSVEADHSAWIRRISHRDPTYTGAFEQPLTKAEVLAAVKATGFIVSAPPPTSGLG